jgi:hypothetical protein
MTNKVTRQSNCGTPLGHEAVRLVRNVHMIKIDRISDNALPEKLKADDFREIAPQIDSISVDTED